jgi:UDPglucose 6-dehydrogenase
LLTGETRENAAVFVAKHLIAERARLEVYDPQVPASQMYKDVKYYNAADNVEKLVTMELDVYEARIESPKGNHQNGEFYFS